MSSTQRKVLSTLILLLMLIGIWYLALEVPQIADTANKLAAAGSNTWDNVSSEVGRALSGDVSVDDAAVPLTSDEQEVIYD